MRLAPIALTLALVATALPADLSSVPFDGVMFLFNGLMQIPGRERRRRATSAASSFSPE